MLEQILFEIAHRKKWLSTPIKTKRYIRGILNNVISDRIHSRRSGQQTTDKYIRAKCLHKTGGRCYLCLRQYTQNVELAKRLPRLYFSSLQIDHVIPFSHFGPNSLSNYMPICGRCNNQKSDLSLGEYRAGKRKAFGRSY